MKKVLSFVLVLSLVLGSFSMAFAADSTSSTSAAGLSDIAGIANEDAIQVCNDLAIVTGNPDGTYLPEKSVTRAEFAAMITRALAIPDSALAGYKTSKFKDTSGYSWAVPYLAFCESKGIILGDGNGNAMPGRPVTVNESVTMALRAIGYTGNSSELTGVWPANYVTVAQNNSLYDDVQKNATAVDKANAAQIIYNLLTVQKVAVNADGETKYLEIDDPDSTNSKDKIAANLMNTGLDCTEEKDTIIDGDDYDNTVINITKYMGAHGTAYKNDDGDIVAFTVKDSVALTGEMDGDDFKVDDVKYTISSKADNFSKVNKPVMIENTKNTGTASESTIKAMIQDMDDTYADDLVTINADVSGKTINEVYSIVGWQATQADTVDQTDLDDIKDNELLSADFDENNDGGIDTTSFALVGVTSLDKIAKGNVVYVYEDKSDDIRMVAVGTEVVEGTVGEIDDNGDKVKVYIDGKKYKPAEFHDGTLKADKAPKLDAVVKLSLDAFGKYYGVDKTGGIADKYGVVKVFTSPAGVDNAKAKIYTSEDSTKTYTFEDWNENDIDFDSNGTTTTALKDAATKGLADNNKDTAVLIGFDVNSEGVIDTINHGTNLGELASNDVKVQSSKVLIDNGKYYDISEDVVVFTYSTVGSITPHDFDIIGVKDVNTNEVLSNSPYFQYIYDADEEEVVAMLVNEVNTDANSDDIFGVFNTVTDVKDGSDTIQKAVGFVDGKEYTQTTTDDNKISYKGSSLSKISLYEIEVNNSNEIKKAYPITNTAEDNDKNKTKDPTVEVANKTVTDISSDRTVFTCGTEKYTAEDNAIVYEAVLKDNKEKVDYYKVAKLSNISKYDRIWMYDTEDGSDHDGIADVVIFADFDKEATNNGGSSTVTTGVTTYIDVPIKAGTDVVAKLTLPSGNKDIYNVKAFDSSNKELNAGITTLATKEITANDLGILKPGTENATYTVKTFKVVSGVYAEVSSKVVKNVDPVNPKMTGAAITTDNALTTATLTAGNITGVAIKAGTPGNSANLVISKGAVNTPFSIVVADPKVTVNLEIDSAGNVVTTLQDVVNAVNADPNASKILKLSVGTANAADKAVAADVSASGGAAAVNVVLALTFDLDMKADTTGKITIDGKEYNVSVIWGSTKTATITISAAQLSADYSFAGKKITSISFVKDTGNAVDLANSSDVEL
ncbi:S-layer homology domain-containing protein [Anaerovorax odorimutans]|uniref:S-layer homology domain-containing protein n=1 Tax=Anaerovorax odorimutans TaxID=109327 RepID=UPI00048658ED|nr:S-layer homology domain-containing protein [Anaerovorax odorimutans]